MARVDPNDTRANPEVDHLSAAATEATRAAAVANNEAIQKAVGSAVQEYGEKPSRADVLQETFNVIGVEESPKLPVADKPAYEPPPVEPKGHTS